MLASLPLEDRLEKVMEEDRMLTDIQYENVKDVVQAINGDGIEGNQVQLNLLK